jgi:hypothetical protein
MSELCGGSLTVEQPTPIGDGGSIPTSSLQSFKVYLVDRIDVRDFIEKHHYSHSINGVQTTFCFALYDGFQKLAGAMLIGKTASRLGKKDGVLEIRRLVCVDDTPRNAESFFIGFVLRWLKKNTEFSTIIAYADLDQGHSGIVYRASNFKMTGKAPDDIKLEYKGRFYHRRSLNIKHNGVLKAFAQELRAALESGAAKTIKTNGKNVYVYNLK